MVTVEPALGVCGETAVTAGTIRARTFTAGAVPV
jgi:hypothetical protein